MTTPHKHADLIKAWADGATIQVEGHNIGWFDVTSPIWDDPNAKYRIKPEPPKYPQTTMTDDGLKELWRQCVVASAPFTDHHMNALRSFADASIARAIEDGLVVPTEKVPGARLVFDAELAQLVPVAMLEQLAVAVYERTIKALGVIRMVQPTLDFAAIIASVRDGK